MYCTNCRRDNPEIARFCEYCGAPLEAEASAGTGLKSTMRGSSAATAKATGTAGVKSTMSGVATTYSDGKRAGGHMGGHFVDGHFEPRDSKITEATASDATDEELDDDEYEYVDVSKSKRKIAIILTLIIVIGAGIGAFFYFRNYGPETVITNYYNAVASGDGEGVYECTINDYARKSMLEDPYDNEAEIIDALNDQYGDHRAEKKQLYGNDFTCTFEIKKVVEYEESDFKKIVEHAESKYGVPADSIEDIRTILTRLNYNGSKKSESVTDEVVVAKIDGQWYIGIHGPKDSLQTRAQIDSILDRETKVVGKDELSGSPAGGTYVAK